MGILSKERDYNKIQDCNGLSFEITTDIYPFKPIHNTIFRVSSGDSGIPEYQRNSYLCNIWYPWDGYVTENEYPDFYITISVDDLNHTIIMYVNGVEFDKKTYAKNYFKEGLDILNDPSIEFEFGRTIHGNGFGNGEYSKVYFSGSVYACRLYN